MSVSFPRLLLSSCLLVSAACAEAPAASTPTVLPPTASPAAGSAATPAPAGPGRPAAAEISLWLPPQFAPAPAQPGGPELAGQLADYEKAHAGWSVRVRAKAAAGPGGLLDSLTSAYNAAPAALPDLIALDRPDLEAAAAAGLLLPLDNWAPVESLQTAYPFAQALGRVQGQWVGLPFAADARILVYNTTWWPTAPLRWADLVTDTLAFPGAEPAGLTLLTDYLSGGPLTDATGRLQFDPGRLTAALTAWQQLNQAGVLPLTTLTYADPAAAWQVFRERRAGLVITTAAWYLREAGRVSTSAAALPPNLTGAPFTLAEGWSWALVNKPGDHAGAADLLNWLNDPARQAVWTLAAGVLPTRPATLAGWRDSPFVPIAAEVAARAQLPPSPNLLNVLGPLLRRAGEDVLNNRATPEAAAAAVAQALTNGQP